MVNLKNNPKKTIILILIFIIILFLNYNIAKSKDMGFREDLIFFEILGNSSLENVDIEIKVTAIP